MSILAERLRVDVEADTSKARREVGSFSGALGAPARGLGMLKGAALAFGGTAVAAFAGKTIMAASDLNEVVSKVGVVFGPQADIVNRKAQQMADAFGIPKTEFLGAASAIGLVAKASGLAQAPAAKMSAHLAKLATDAASFYNVPLDEALAAMQSGLVGEAEPMRRFGVLLSEAAVKTEAYRLGIAKTGSELTEGQKVQARASLITKGMADANGDLARTQDSVANQLREIKGRAVNAAASLGTALLPAVSATLNGLIGFAGMVKTVVGSIIDWAKSNPQVQQTLDTISGAVGQLRGWISQMLPVVEAWLTSMGQRLLPVLQQVGQWISANIIPIILQMAGIIKTNVIPAARDFADWFTTRVIPAAMAMWGVIAHNLAPVFQQVADTVRGSVLPMLQNLMAKFRENQPAIQGVVEKVQTFVAKAAALASVILGTVLPPLLRLAGFLLEHLVPVIADVIIVAIKIIGKMFEIASAFLDAGEAVAKFVGKVGRGIADAIGFVLSLDTKVAHALSDVGTWLIQGGKDLVLGFINGIKAMAGQAGQAAADMAKAAVDKAKSFLHIGSPSKLMEQIGKWTGEGFANGLSGTAEQVGATMDALMAKAKDAAGKGSQSVLDTLDSVLSGAKGKLTRLGDELSKTGDYFAQINGSVRGTGNVSGLGGRQDENGMSLAPTAATVIQDLQKRVSDAATFAKDLVTLKAKGLNAQAISDLAQAGVDQAGAAASALAGGGKAVIDQVNGLQGQLAASAKIAAQVGSAAMYAAGVATAQGIAAGFASQRKVILGEMDDISAAMIKRLKKRLGINSPAKEGVFVGRMTGLGVQRGAEGTLAALGRTSDRMAQAVLPTSQTGFRASGWQPGLVPSTAPNTAAVGETIGSVHFHEANLSPAEQARALTWALTTRSR